MQKTAYCHRYAMPVSYPVASSAEETIINQILRIMRLTVLFFIVCCVHVSANTFSQTLTLSGKDLPLKHVFSEIKKQTGYVVFFSLDDLNRTQPVSVDATDMHLTDFLDLILKDQPLNYRIADKSIILVKGKPKAVPWTSPDMLPQLPVEGQVTDLGGLPLSGASVRVRGAKDGKMTDKNGRFAIKAAEGDELIISFVGYKDVTVKVKNGTFVSTDPDVVVNGSVIRMTFSQTALQEIVVNKGYYSTSQRLNTGNVSKVKGEDIRKQPIANPILSLQGRVPGLYVAQGSGVPGSYVTVRLRGQNSIASGNDPLYILDGVPFNATGVSRVSGVGGGSNSPFSTIAMSDIESIEVLKDADATAIYGSRGANGVILITTKKGRSGKTRVDVDLSHGFSKASNFLPLMDTKQYLAMRREAFANDGAVPGPTDYDLNGTWDTTRYTDWQKLLIGNTGYLTNAQISVSGGTAQTRFLLGGGYRRESTIFAGNFSDKRISLHSNIQHNSVNQLFRLDFSTSYTRNFSALPQTDFLLNYVRMVPNAPELYLPNGELNWAGGTWENPMAETRRRARSQVENLVSNLVLGYTILPGLQLQLTGGYNRQQADESSITPFSSYNPSYAYIANILRNNTVSNGTVQTWNLEPQLNYSQFVGPGKLDVLIGSTFQEQTQNIITSFISNFPDDVSVENPSAGTDIFPSGYVNTIYRHNAIFGRLNYNLYDKYLFNITARRDGSSRFGPGKRFGNFGALGAAWIFSEEYTVRKHLPFLSYGKLRASIGSTGLEKASDYEYLSTYSYNNASGYLNTIGLYPTQLTNPDYAWEVNKKIEGGLDLGFAKDRILAGAVYYRNRTSNQLVGYPLPGITGFSSITYNLPAVVQNTGFELELNTKNIQGKDFTWTTSFNISFPRNKLVSYPNIEGSSYAHRYKVGMPLFTGYYIRSLGVDPQTGTFTFEDKNKDGVLSYPEDYSFTLGAGYQRYFGGLTNTFTYKGLQLDFLFFYINRRGYRPHTGLPGYFAGGGQANQTSWVTERWQKPGDIKPYQPYSQQWPNPRSEAHVTLLNNSDYNIVDIAYIRLRNLTLSYTLPDRLKQLLKMQDARIYMMGQNLFTLTDFRGYDPETSTNIPPLRNFTFGLQVSF